MFGGSLTPVVGMGVSDAGAALGLGGMVGAARLGEGVGSAVGVAAGVAIDVVAAGVVTPAVGADVAVEADGETVGETDTQPITRPHMATATARILDNTALLTAES